MFISILLLCIALAQCTIASQQKFARSSALGNRHISTQCSILLNDLPQECAQQARHIGRVGTVADLDVACNKTCGELIYNAFRECDDFLAITIDFSCSKNSHGRLCGDVLANEAIDIPPGCFPITHHFCPPCQRGAVSMLNDDWGCCYYTTLTLAGAVNFFDACNIQFPPLCIGAYSGEAIRALNSGDTMMTALGFLHLAVPAFLTALNL